MGWGGRGGGVRDGVGRTGKEGRGGGVKRTGRRGKEDGEEG